MCFLHYFTSTSGIPQITCWLGFQHLRVMLESVCFGSSAITCCMSNEGVLGRPPGGAVGEPCWDMWESRATMKRGPANVEEKVRHLLGLLGALLKRRRFPVGEWVALWTSWLSAPCCGTVRRSWGLVSARLFPVPTTGSSHVLTSPSSWLSWRKWN